MRVAITGYGVVCAVGSSVATAWGAIARGDRGIGPITLFDVSAQRTSIAAEVKDLVVPAPLSEGGARWSRSDSMALIAARQALAEANVEPRTMRVGLIVGATTGGMFETEAILARMHADPRERVPNPEMLAHPLSATVDRLASALGPFARARTVCSACSSGANAFALGKAWIELGLVDAVLVGGTDGLCRLTFTGFNALNAIDPSPARPFDVNRRGLTLGEGAGFAVLEDAARADARGVPHHVELVGVGITSEAHHITNPQEDGVMPARAIERALKQAGLAPTDVDYVNAHGTATPLNDAMEARAIERALEGETSRVYVSSTKGQIGHTLGAAGAIEAIVAALAVRDGKLPPTAGLEEIDPRCAKLRHVPKGGVDHDVRVALSNAFGFGGVDTVLALARKGYAPDRTPARVNVWVTGIGSASRAGGLQWDENVKLFDAPPLEHEDPTAFLDAARARRLDRAARLATTAAQLAWSSGHDGIFLGSSYGDADGSAAFLAKTFDKGPRLAPPAEFPNLVPSSPSGHVSIYLSLHGAALALADLETSGEAAIATAYELIAAGFLEAASAGSVEGPSEIAANCLAPVFRQAAGVAAPPSRDRTEGSAVVRLTREPGTEAMGDLERIEVRQVLQAEDGASLMSAVEPPREQAIVVVAEANAQVLSVLLGTPWSRVPVRDVVTAVGRHEGLGGFAVAAAAAAIVKGQAEHALVLGVSRGRTYGITLARVR